MSEGCDGRSELTAESGERARLPTKGTHAPAAEVAERGRGSEAGSCPSAESAPRSASLSVISEICRRREESTSLRGVW